MIENRSIGMVHGTFILAFESRLSTTKLKTILLESFIESELSYLIMVVDSGFLLKNSSGLAEVVQGLTSI